MKTGRRKTKENYKTLMNRNTNNQKSDDYLIFAAAAHLCGVAAAGPSPAATPAAARPRRRRHGGGAGPSRAAETPCPEEAVGGLARRHGARLEVLMISISLTIV